MERTSPKSIRRTPERWCGPLSSLPLILPVGWLQDWLQDWLVGSLLACVLVALSSVAAGQEALVAVAVHLHGIDFARQIEPIFESRCFECHGPVEQRFGLRLDRRGPALLGGDSGEPGIVPGESARSEVFRRIATDDDLDRMPPKGSPLTEEETLLIQRWIDEGAVWSSDSVHDVDDLDEVPRTGLWSFQPIGDPTPPGTEEPWGESPVDAFVLARL